MTRVGGIAAASVILAGLTSPALIMPALAGEACDGSLQGSRLQDVPNPLTVSVDYPRKTPRAKAAVAAFTEGVQAAGVNVAPNSATTLRLTFLVSAPSGNGEVQQFSDFSWAETEASADGPPPTITITIGLFGRSLGSLLWVASVECQVKTRDPNVLAREIGQVVGQSLGKDVGQTSF